MAKNKKQQQRKERAEFGSKDVEVPVKKIKIRVVGIGGGASSIISDIASELKGAKFLVANTDRTSLARFKKSIDTFQFGEGLTGGFGTGMDMELGSKAAVEAKEKITELLKDYDLCVLIACLGGGTGSGASPVFAEIAKNLGNLTFGIFTLPFSFEGKKKLEIAKESLKRSAPLLNAVTVVPNERIFKIVDRKLPLKKALSMINKTLAFNLNGLLDMIYKAGIINIDFADIKTILSGRGAVAYLNRVESKGEGRAKKAVQDVLNNPLYSFNISKAGRILFNIGAPLDLSLQETSQVSQAIFDSAQAGSKIIFGVSQIKEKDKIEISLLALGCEMKDFFQGFKKREKKKKRKKKTSKVLEEEKKDKDRVKTKIEEVLEPVESAKKKKGNTGSKKKKTKKKPAISLAARRARQNEKLLSGESEPKATPEQEDKEAKQGKIKAKIRKNALQVQKDIQALEQELTKEEEIWETPAFLRKKT